MTKELGVSGVIFSGYVDDFELDIILSNAEAFVWPTLYEGFGLPPIEAMAKGIPVVSSDHECMKEILGNSAHYFNGINLESMENEIVRVLKDNKLRKNLIYKGYLTVAKYNWREMALKTLKIYQEVNNKNEKKFFQFKKE